MSRTSVLILLGVFVILVPFSGLPSSVRTLLAVILGACVFGMGLSQRAREARSAAAHSSAPPPEPPSSGVSPI